MILSAKAVNSASCSALISPFSKFAGKAKVAKENKAALQMTEVFML